MLHSAVDSRFFYILNLIGYNNFKRVCIQIRIQNFDIEMVKSTFVEGLVKLNDNAGHRTLLVYKISSFTTYKLDWYFES